jgi:acyl-CoA hydrolase
MVAAMPVARSSLTRSNVIGADDAGHIAVDTNAEVHLDEWIAPEAVDDNGLLRGGRILEWMDVGGALAASRFCRRACVTASVNGVDIYRPIEVGEHVSMSARVAHTSRRSIGVHVTLRARGGKLLSDSEVLAAYMTFVPGDMQQGGEVNGWTPLTPRDRVLAREGDLRREFRQLLTSGAYLEADGGEAPAPERASLRTLARDVRRIVPFLESEPASGPARSPEASYVHRIEPVFAGSMNMHGTLYGGTLMRWIEDAAGLSARAFTDTAMVAQGVHGLDFLKPVSCHTFLHTHAMAVRADNRSVTVLVEVTSEDPTSGTAQQSLRGFFTYRPLDRRAVVPALVVHSHAERALWAESAQHIAFSRRLREQ